MLHEVKRTVWDNILSKADAIRLARSMSNPAAPEDVEKNAGAASYSLPFFANFPLTYKLSSPYTQTVKKGLSYQFTDGAPTVSVTAPTSRTGPNGLPGKTAPLFRVRCLRSPARTWGGRGLVAAGVCSGRDRFPRLHRGKRQGCLQSPAHLLSDTARLFKQAKQQSAVLTGVDVATMMRLSPATISIYARPRHTPQIWRRKNDKGH